MNTYEIDKVLDEKVRPYLNAHGGDVIPLEFEDGVLRVRLTGKCSGCPAAHITNEEIIRDAVCEAVSGVKDVILVEDVSDELIAAAKKILNHEC